MSVWITLKISIFRTLVWWFIFLPYIYLPLDSHLILETKNFIFLVHNQTSIGVKFYKTGTLQSITLLHCKKKNTFDFEPLLVYNKYLNVNIKFRKEIHTLSELTKCVATPAFCTSRPLSLKPVRARYLPKYPPNRGKKYPPPTSGNKPKINRSG